MTMHIYHPDDRPEFLVDDCPRCAEYADEDGYGVDLDAERWRQFWAYVVRVEYLGTDHYRSALDAKLGRKFYRFMVGLQRSFGFDPVVIADGFVSVTDPRD